MFNEERDKITIRYCLIKGVVGYFMHISADKRLLKKDRRIAQIIFFGILTVFFCAAFFLFPKKEEAVKLISIILAGICLVLCAVFAVIYQKGKKNYIFAEDQIIDLEVSEAEIKASVNEKERVIPLNKTVHFTQNSECYIIKDKDGGLFIPFSELDPNEKTLVDLWFVRGFVYDEPKLSGRERAPKMKF